MTRQEVYENLNEVFQYVFDDDSIEVNDETTANDIEDWDSFEHINLVIAVEKRFQVKFTVGEANEMKNVGEMVDIILERMPYPAWREGVAERCIGWTKKRGSG